MFPVLELAPAPLPMLPPTPGLPLATVTQSPIDSLVEVERDVRSKLVPLAHFERQRAPVEKKNTVCLASNQEKTEDLHLK